MDSLHILAKVGEYWRYERQHPLIAYEVDGSLLALGNFIIGWKEGNHA